MCPCPPFPSLAAPLSASRASPDASVFPLNTHAAGPPSQPKEKLKAPVPKRDEKPVMGLKSSKNFITTNAVEVILASPKRAEEPLPMTMRPGFGKVPKYLKRNKEWVAQERARLDTYMRMREEEANDVAPTLSEEERADLLRHLKRKWESVNAAYQKLPFALDTRNQIRQKENLEKELAEIESDIKTLARGEIVYILPDA